MRMIRTTVRNAVQELIERNGPNWSYREELEIRNGTKPSPTLLPTLLAWAESSLDAKMMFDKQGLLPRVALDRRGLMRCEGAHVIVRTMLAHDLDYALLMHMPKAYESMKMDPHARIAHALMDGELRVLGINYQGGVK